MSVHEGLEWGAKSLKRRSRRRATTRIRSFAYADTPFGEFRERNSRGWRSEAHVSGSGMAVVTLTHPGRADWRNPDADPFPLIQEVLAR